MTEPRFFLPPEAIRGTHVTFPPEQSHQIARVLRLRPGAAVFVLDNTGHLYTVRLERVHPRQVTGTVVSVEAANNEPPVEVVLYQAILKGERMDFVLQKGTELGIRRFVPVLTERTVVRRTEKRPRWERIVQEAAEQCRRSRLPAVDDIRSFAEAVAEASTYPCALLAHNGPDVPRWRDLWPRWETPPEHVALFIGPEGGFTDEEVTTAQAAGIHLVHLGPRTLRAETAALVATTLLMYHWGDVG